MVCEVSAFFNQPPSLLSQAVAAAAIPTHFVECAKSVVKVDMNCVLDEVILHLNNRIIINETIERQMYALHVIIPVHRQT